MHRCLVLLSSWSLLVAHSLQCETGVAFVDSILSVPRSLMANADVAFLKSYGTTSIKQCMEDCCNGKFGACSVASFKKNATKENCLHFNCRPLPKCKFLSSPSTDSFSFSANPTSPKPVPSDHLTSTHRPSTLARYQSKSDITVLDDEQFALKNDNTTIKPRKGVDDSIPDDPQGKSGIKPRKGVSLDDVPHSQFLLNSQKSNVKARKGVGPYSTSVDLLNESTTAGRYSSSSVVKTFSVTPTQHYSTVSTDDLMADLAKILEDDSVTTTESSAITVTPVSHTSQTVNVTPSPVRITSSAVPETTQSTSIPLYSSESSSSRDFPQSSSSRTPTMQTLPVFRETTVSPPASMGSELPIIAFTTTRHRPLTTQTLNAENTSTRVEQEVTMDKLVSLEEETDSDRKYKSSIHLVLSLVFGLLVLFAVLGVVAKRVYDGWLRRDYYRMNYLIDGIYNGVE